MNQNKKALIITLSVLATVIVISTGFSYATHIDESDPDWQCKKWIGITELAKQGYPHFLEDSLTMGKMKCGFDISEFI